MTFAQEKHAARAAAFARRKAAHADAPPDVTRYLETALAPHHGKAIAGYLPIRTEIDPRPAMANATRHGPVAVPVIVAKGESLRFALWTPETSLFPGPFGAMIPKDPAFIDPEILIVPLVAFTRDGDRLGYGGGFYDRTLERLRAARPTLAIGFAYAGQQTDELPTDPTDQNLDLIVTESAIHSP